VRTFAANGFGLYDVAGNVWEWCRDWFGSYSLAVREGDGERMVPLGARLRVYRGGSFGLTAMNARSALRFGDTPDYRSVNLGCRPARCIHH
jgi:formylglycine-generating enzyme required for sulfatase activity